MENILLYLVLLACPVGMGIMMWMMGRHQSHTTGSTQVPAGGAVAQQSNVGAGEGDRIASLVAQLQEVQAQQAALAQELRELMPGTPAISKGANGDVEQAAQPTKTGA